MDSHTIRFLLVEDDDDHATLIERCLVRAKTPCEVEHVRDGIAALNFLQECVKSDTRSLPDVILLDIKLPRLSGLEVLEQIRADPGLRDRPVTILSTSDATCDRMRAYELRANSFLVKQLQYSDFRDMLESFSEYWGRWNRPPFTHDT